MGQRRANGCHGHVGNARAVQSSFVSGKALNDDVGVSIRIFNISIANSFDDPYAEGGKTSASLNVKGDYEGPLMAENKVGLYLSEAKPRAVRLRTRSCCLLC